MFVMFQPSMAAEQLGHLKGFATVMPNKFNASIWRKAGIRLSTLMFLMIACAVLAFSPSSWASEKSSEEKPPEPMVFIVNIGKSFSESRILRVVVVLEYADSAVAHYVSAFRPKLMHQILMALSEQGSESLLSTKGKVDLRKKIVGEINGLFNETEKTGVKDALFTDFVIQ